MLQKRGATRGRAMGAVHKGSDAKPHANRRAVGGGRLLGPKQRGGGAQVGEAGMGTGGGRRRKATWLKCARWDGVFARQVEGWRAAHVCVCVCGTGVEQSAVARSSLGNVRCQQQQEHVEHCLQPEQRQDGSSVGRSCTVSTPDQ